MTDARKTTDHKTIRQWIEAHGGAPATVASTEEDGDPGVLRVKFSDQSSDELEEISWDDFFEKFDEEDLAFLYQDDRNSRFCKFVRADT